MPQLTLYNTESRQKEVIRPLRGNTISLYTCGPTVYNFAHIGNFRTYVFEDLLRRTLRFFGFHVHQAMNLTDVDDKTIEGALKSNQSIIEYTRPYTEAFFEDLQTLGIERVEHYPAATEYIDQMVRIIEKLLEKSVAYRGDDGSVYFRISSFPNYGRLSHFHLCELRPGGSNRVEDEYGKDEAADFVLWKAYDPARDGKIFWESTLGRGRPGWHIECSTMAMSLLGESIDIHVGGVDNMFPHHENEIAQSEALSEKKFVQHWLHVEHLLVDHKKMSKSLGNFYTLRDLLQKGYTGQQVRYALLQTHYKTQLNFTFAVLEAAAASLQRMEDCLERLRQVEQEICHGKVGPIIDGMIHSFSEALADDINISVGLAHLFHAIHQLHVVCDQCEISRKEATDAIEAIYRLDAVLGVLALKKEENIPEEIEKLFIQRQQAREEKNWALSDLYREQILQKGYKIEDSPRGAKLKKV